jgi:hypothetical protein
MSMHKPVKKLSTEQHDEIIRVLMSRFEQNMHRHQEIEWENLYSRLISSPENLWSLHEMERTGGEPDVVRLDMKSGKYIFFDCAQESPAGRRSICYDRQALETRKDAKPGNNAADLAAAMGIEILTEEQYFELQKLGEFDTRTSSWLKTPSDVRKLGGALFGDRRYGRVFIYHNGAQSWYGARGFRGWISV